MKIIKKLSEVVNKIVSQICIYSFGIMTIVVLLGIIFRYVLKLPLSWSEETSRYLMIMGAAMAISIGIKDNEHVGFTLLFESVKNRFFKMILIIISFCTILLFLLIMFYYSIGMVSYARFQISQGLGITMFIPTMIIPVSMSVAIVQLILKFLLSINEFSSKPVKKIK